VSDIDTPAVDSLKVLDPKWPIREAEVEYVLHTPTLYLVTKLGVFFSIGEIANTNQVFQPDDLF
jgi:hypothetical protein